MDETPETMRRLQAIIHRSAATAGSAVRRNFAAPAWSMSAEEFVAFWRGPRMAAISTASRSGEVHIAPLEVRLVDGKFYVPTFPDARRLADHRENPRCAISSWDDAYTAVIVYGIAREVRPDAAGGSAGMVTVEVTPTRIYAIRPPAGQHAAR